MRTLLLLLSLLSLLAVACGGKVVVDKDTGGTSGSSGATCADVCEATATACGTTSTAQCDAQCAKIDPLFESACPDLWDAFLACSVKTPACGSTGSCTAEVNALAPCIMTACANDPIACSGM